MDVGAAMLSVDWVLPHWLQEQLLGSSPASDALRPPLDVTNGTVRNWTTLGNVASTRKAAVDPRGLVTPLGRGWSLDWWIGGDDRWHFPCRDTGVRQRLVDDTPVVETAMRVPGGDAVHRAYAVRAPGPSGLDDVVVVEIHNRTSVPFAVAVAVRPYDTERIASIERIALDGCVVTVDGAPAVLLPGPPRRMAGSTLEGGDSATSVVDGDASDRPMDEVRCPAGMAQGAFLYPLAHTAVLRICIPLGLPTASRQRVRARVTPGRTSMSRPVVSRQPHLASSADAARAWQTQTRRGMRVDLPEGGLSDALEANRRYLLLFHQGRVPLAGPHDALLVATLDRYGFHDSAAEVLSGLGRRPQAVASGPWLWALAEHGRITGDAGLIRSLVSEIAMAVGAIERGSHPRRPPGRRRTPPASRAEMSYDGLFWSVSGLTEGAGMLGRAGQADAGTTAAAWTAAMWSDVLAWLAADRVRLGSEAIAGGPGRDLDHRAVGSLVGGSPLHLLEPAGSAIAATVDALNERFCDGEAILQPGRHPGLATYSTLQLAAVELATGRRRALQRLRWLVDAATPTWTWPEIIDPRSGAGCAGDGHHAPTAVAFCSLMRDLLVRDVPGGLALLSLVPDSWLGQAIEVHRAPTHAGELSFAVRWHGARPALLWELQRRDGSGPVRLSVGGLDPTWSSTEPAGEALLSPALGPGPTEDGAL